MTCGLPLEKPVQHPVWSRQGRTYPSLLCCRSNGRLSEGSPDAKKKFNCSGTYSMRSGFPCFYSEFPSRTCPGCAAFPGPSACASTCCMSPSSQTYCSHATGHVTSFHLAQNLFSRLPKRLLELLLLKGMNKWQEKQ